MTTLLILAAVTVAVGASVLALLWVRDRLIDRTGDRFDYGLTPDDAPRDDSDWRGCGHPNHGKPAHDCTPFLRPYTEHQRRINGDT